MSILSPSEEEEEFNKVTITRKRYRELLDAEEQSMAHLGKRTFQESISARNRSVLFQLGQRLDISDQTKTNMEKIKKIKQTERNVPKTVVQKTSQSITLPSPTLPKKAYGRMVGKCIGGGLELPDWPHAGWNGIFDFIK